MRDTFKQTILDLSQHRKEIIVLTADLGFSVFEDFAAKYPDRFINTGVAESTMIGVAAGLAAEGFHPIVYSISPFLTMRCFEQIRINLCYQDLPVTLVGVGGGLAYGIQGTTHHAIEDVSIMRSLPNMQVVVPADPVDTRRALMRAVAQRKPTYIRLSINKAATFHHTEVGEYDGIVKIDQGNDLAIISVGPILKEVLQVKADLEAEQITPAVYSLSMIKPLPEVSEIIKAHRKIVIVEEHSIIGGASSAICEYIADAGLMDKVELLRIGIQDLFPTKYGGRDYLLEHLDMNSHSIARKILRFLKR